MAQQFYVQIRSEENNPMSQVKPASPKMINHMKDLCIKYTEIFGLKYTVHRFITTPKGLKRV